MSAIEARHIPEIATGHHLDESPSSSGRPEPGHPARQLQHGADVSGVLLQPTTTRTVPARDWPPGARMRNSRTQLHNCRAGSRSHRIAIRDRPHRPRQIQAVHSLRGREKSASTSARTGDVEDPQRIRTVDRRLTVIASSRHRELAPSPRVAASRPPPTPGRATPPTHRPHATRPPTDLLSDPSKHRGRVLCGRSHPVDLSTVSELSPCLGKSSLRSCIAGGDEYAGGSVNDCIPEPRERRTRVPVSRVQRPP